MMLTLVLGERPSDQVLAKTEAPGEKPPAMAKLDNVLSGLAVEAITADNRNQFGIPEDAKGVVVSNVESGSAVEAAGIQPGDLIQEVSRTAVKTLDDYQQIASKIAKDELVVLLVNRRGNNLFVAVNPK
jgi:serine protease Do